MICSNCKIPLDAERHIEYRINGDPSCAICLWMFATINHSKWFVKAQEEEEEYRQKIARLRLGADYLK